MKKIYFYILLACIFLTAGFTTASSAQVLNPADPIVVYNPLSPPVQPAYGQIGKWVITRDITSWVTDPFKAYIYKGMQFRLMFPHSYKSGVSDGKTYPLIIMFHGAGEIGDVYDNDKSLIHGGLNELNAENSGAIDAFVLHAQNATGYWGPTQYGPISELIGIFASTAKVDPLRVAIHGLSAGGIGCWDFLGAYPKLVANAAVQSAADPAFTKNLNVFKYSPLWLSQGGQDQNPTPATGNAMAGVIRASGANLAYFYFTNDGHDTWDDTYSDPGFFPFMTTGNKTNPIVFFQKSGFCPGNPVNAKLGVTAGFDGYQWRKNKVPISTATTNELMVTDTGYYDVSIKNGGVWSYYSPVPAHIYIQAILPAPAIVLARKESNVFPVLDSSQRVSLTIPGSFLHYAWMKTGSSTIIDTNQVFKATAAGSYQVSVTLNNGCSSLNSPSYTVVPAPGTNAPPPATNVLGYAPSYTTIRLLWSQNPAPSYNETGFEIYRSLTSGGPYTFAGITPADTSSFLDTGLQPNTKYYYLIRAVNLTGASVATTQIAVVTQVDNIPPTAPSLLTLTSSSGTTLSVSWKQATDNVGIYQYYIYINGLKSYVVDSTTRNFTVNNLTPGQEYTVVIRAVDGSRNISPASNQVTAFSADKGLTYKYYTFPTAPGVLPNFNSLVPVSTGNIHNTDISIATQALNFGYVWTGTLFVPVTGSYTIGSASDDGSKVFLDAPYDFTAPPLINNDGSHGVINVEATKVLTAGPHKITIAYFQGGGGSAMQLYWRNTPIPGITAITTIADSFFVSKVVVPHLVPVAPSGLSATGVTYKQINLTWTLPADSTHSLTGFELTRSSQTGGPYITIASLGSTVSTYTDSTGLAGNTAYYYQIRSVGTSGQSAYVPATGLLQQYYPAASEATNFLPDFNTLTPAVSAQTNNISIASATQAINFCFKWSGSINIPATGAYTFGTTSDDGSKLYIDQPYTFAAVPLVNNDGPHGAVSAEGTINLTKGRHTLIATYEQLGGGFSMVAYYKKLVNGVLTKVPLPDSLFSGSIQGRTKALPALASAPGVITLKNISGTKLQLNFTDTTTIASTYQIYRSVGNLTSFNLLATVPAGKLQSYVYLDTALFAGVTYSYKVRAVNITGPGVFSQTASATTVILAPILGRIPNISVQYGTTKQIQITSSDPQGLKVTLSALNLPAFASLKDYGDGTGLLTLKPLATNLGVFNQVIISAFNGKATGSDTLSINVNNTFPPAVDSLPGKTITALDSTVVRLHAVDMSASRVIFTTNALPAFITLVSSGAFTANLILHPGIHDVGTYQVAVTATDSLGGTSTRNFTLVVNPYVKSQQISINFNGAANSNAPAPFNNTTGAPALNFSYPNLVNATGTASTIGFRVTSNWAALSAEGHGSPGADYGPSTYNNSGIFPDLVEESCWWTDTTPETIQFFGLQKSHTYDFTLYGATKFSGINFVATYQIGAKAVTLDGTNNTTSTVAIKGVTADSSGTVTLTMSNKSGGFAYLNALVLNDNFITSGVPLAPTNLAATNTPTGVSLQWQDNAVNENGYQVFRKLITDTAYVMLKATVPANITTFADSSVLIRMSYDYKVRAYNTQGNSAFTNIAVANISVKAPVLAPITSGIVKTDSVYVLTIHTTDDSLSLTQLHLSAAGLPSSAVFTDKGNGTGLLTFTPRTADIGVYTITITAADITGLTASRTFTLSVQDKNIVSTYINFNQTAADAALKPFNNTNSLAYAGFGLTNLSDQYGNNSGISLNFVNAWSGLVDYGVQTGNNSGVYPDAVLKGFYYTSLADTMRIQLTGLNPLKKYNLDMIGSWANPYAPCVTNYTVGTATITQDPTNNSSHLVSFKGLSSDAKGNLQLKVSKAASSTYGIINALVISSFTDNGVPISPAALTAIPTSTSAIALNWQDRAYNETGFYILRSASPAGPFVIVDSVLQNVTVYQSKGLSGNTTYYYEVIAKGATLNSSPSNIASASTLIFLVRVNFNLNSTDAAPAPWNNTNSLPSSKITLPLNDEYGNSTGVVMSFARNFTDYNNLGAQTGNDSGIFPDAVLKGFYYSVYPDSAIILFSNLNVNASYDLSPLASYGNYYFGSTIYQVGNRSVTLNPQLNTSVVAVFSNIVPDANGQIRLKVKGAPGASFAFINGLTLQAHAYNANGNNLLATGEKFESAAGIVSSNKTFTVFPNPFTDRVAVKLYSKTAGSYRVSVYDYTGRAVYIEPVQQLYANSYINHEVNLSAAGLATGIYILKITSDVLPAQSLKIIKN